MDTIKPPESLSLTENVSENWKRWIQKFKLYLKATDLMKKEDPHKCAIFLHCIGEDGMDVYNSFVFGHEEEDHYDILVKKFEDYTSPKKNTTCERLAFNSRKQAPGEGFDQFVTVLKNKAKTCEFGDLKNSLILDRIIMGILDSRLKEKLLRDAKDLNKAIEIGQAFEASRSQLESIASAEQEHIKELHVVTRDSGRRPQKYQTHDVPSGTRSETGGGGAIPKNAMSGNHAQTHSETSTRREAKPDNPRKSRVDCTRCGYTHNPQRCPAYGKVCFSCGGLNHFGRCCFKREHKTVNTLEYSQNIQAMEHSIDNDTTDINKTTEHFSIGSVASGSNDVWYVTLKIGPNQQKIKFKIDSGAQIDVIPYDLYKRAKLENACTLMNDNVRLTGFGEVTIPIVGTCMLSVGHNDMMITRRFAISEANSGPVLSWSTSLDLKLIARLDTLTSDHDMCEELLKQYTDVFEGLGCVDQVYKIVLNDNANPMIHAPRKVPLALRDKFKAELDRMEAANVIEQVNIPTDWVNSIVVVEKPNGSLRVCLDPKDLNKAIKREHFYMPSTDEFSNLLSGAQYFSVLDASQGFWQIKLDDTSSMYTTFNTPFGRYRFKRLPYGIASASEVFNKAVTQILEGIEGCTNYVDDILVWGNDRAEHDARLKSVLERLRERGLKLNREKCQIALTELKYVGGILTRQGLLPNPEKIEAVVKMPDPRCIKDVQRFLGLVQYFSKHIPNMTTLTEPLRKLLHKETFWHWGHEQKQCMSKLKDIMTKAPVLKYFDSKRPVVLTVDASQTGLGGAILQDGKPVAFASRSLTDAEQNYAQIEKETLAVTFGCEKFHHYLYGRKFTVESDHRPL